MGFWARLKAWLTGGRRSRGATPRGGAEVGGGRARVRSAAPGPSPAGADSGAFVKLAERYLGMQMADTALHVCQRGLEAHPGHVAGRSLLARIYVAKGMRGEAQALIDTLVAELGDAPEVAALKGLMTSGASPSARGGDTVAAAAHAPTADPSRRELQALETYLGRIRRELTRLGPV